MILTKNPVYSVLSLIAIFLNISVILIIHNFDFLGLIILLVYVGAIAVLFLFIIMMINIKKIENITSIYMLISSSIFFLFFFYITYMIWSIYIFNIPIELSSNINIYTFNYSSFISDSNNNINLLNKVGFYLFNDYYLCIWASGILLLISIIGSIFITNFKKGFSNKAQFNQFFRINTILHSHMY